MSKYGGFSGPYFPVFGLNTERYGVSFTPYLSVFSPNTEKYEPEKTPYLDIFHVVIAYLYGNIQNKPKRRCYKDTFNQTYTLILLLSNTTINIFAKTTFEQIMVNFSINWLYKLIHHANFRFGFQEVEICFEQVLWLENWYQKLIGVTER